MLSTESPAPSPAGTPPLEVVRAAFRDLHGRRLHGFALLLTLGDRAGAARLTAGALADATDRLAELRHPERAAAWLRSHVVDRARSLARRPVAEPAAARSLDDLGAGDAVVAGLAALDRIERAALIAANIERLDRRDVAVVIGRDGPGLDRVLTRARRRYAAAHALAAPQDPPSGPLAERVREIARQAMA